MLSPRVLLPALLLAPLVMLAPGCTAGSAVGAQLQACGLVSDGELGPAILERFYEPDDCYRACLGGATCDELNDTLCRSSIDLLRRCDLECAYRCDDGALLAVNDVCNGLVECEGGEDEAGCPTITCANGSTVSGTRCDGVSSCEDGSDETGCPTCPTIWGDESPFMWSRCDGSAFCTDGSDEAGCPTFTCADGQVVTYRRRSPRCDGWSICGDGSDEADCATLTLRCE